MSSTGGPVPSFPWPNTHYSTKYGLIHSSGLMNYVLLLKSCLLLQWTAVWGNINMFMSQKSPNLKFSYFSLKKMCCYKLVAHTHITDSTKLLTSYLTFYSNYTLFNYIHGWSDATVRRVGGVTETETEYWSTLIWSLISCKKTHDQLDLLLFFFHVHLRATPSRAVSTPRGSSPGLIDSLSYLARRGGTQSDLNELITCWSLSQKLHEMTLMQPSIPERGGAAGDNSAWWRCLPWKRWLFHVLHFPPYDYFSREKSWDFSAAEVIWRARYSALNTVLICNANYSHLNNPPGWYSAIIALCIVSGADSPLRVNHWRSLSAPAGPTAPELKGQRARWKVACTLKGCMRAAGLTGHRSQPSVSHGGSLMLDVRC